MLPFDALAFEVVPPLGGVGSGLHKRAVPCRRAAVYNLTYPATKAMPYPVNSTTCFAMQCRRTLFWKGIADSMRAHQVHAPVIRLLFGSPHNRSMVGVAGRPVQQIGKELVHILGGAEIGGRLNGRIPPKSH